MKVIKGMATAKRAQMADFGVNANGNWRQRFGGGNAAHFSLLNKMTAFILQCGQQAVIGGEIAVEFRTLICLKNNNRK